MDGAKIPLGITDMIENRPHPIQTIQANGVSVLPLLEVGERFHIAAELIEVTELHAVTVMQGLFLVNVVISP